MKKLGLVGMVLVLLLPGCAPERVKTRAPLAAPPVSEDSDAIEADEGEPEILTTGAGLGESPQELNAGIVLALNRAESEGPDTQAFLKALEGWKTLAGQYFEEASGSRLKVKFKIFGVVRPAEDFNPCPGLLKADRDRIEQAAAAQRGYRASDFHFFMTFMKTSCSRHPATASLGGRYSHFYVPTWNPALTAWMPRTMVHELGHNLGLPHAHTLRCLDTAGARVPIAERCNLVEYGDFMDVMGINLGKLPAHLSAPRKQALGWTTPKNAIDVQKPGIYDLNSWSGASEGTRFLRIQVKAVPTIYLPGSDDDSSDEPPKVSPIFSKGRASYYVEFRQPEGFDETLAAGAPFNATQGVSIRLALAPSETARSLRDRTETFLIHTNAGTGSKALPNHALEAGQVFRDPRAGVFIQALEITPERARVQVCFTESCLPKPVYPPMIAYLPDRGVFVQGKANPAILPMNFGGEVSRCRVEPVPAGSPAWPAGLNLNPRNCAINGVATHPLQPTRYQIVAENSGGTSAASIELSVVAPAPNEAEHYFFSDGLLEGWTAQGSNNLITAFSEENPYRGFRKLGVASNPTFWMLPQPFATAPDLSSPRLQFIAKPGAGLDLRASKYLSMALEIDFWLPTNLWVGVSLDGKFTGRYVKIEAQKGWQDYRIPLSELTGGSPGKLTSFSIWGFPPGPQAIDTVRVH